MVSTTKEWRRGDEYKKYEGEEVSTTKEWGKMW